MATKKEIQQIARGSIGVTATGTSGDATYNSTTGIINIPNYANGVGYQVTPEQYGAIGNGIVDDAAALQAAITATCLSVSGGSLWLQPNKTYLTGTTLVIPDYTQSGDIPRFSIIGNNATLKTTSAITILKKAVTNQTDAETQINSAVTINAVRFLGTSTTDQIGCNIQATYGSNFTQCQFVNLDTGLKLEFCLAARVEQCYTINNVTTDFFAGFGSWSGATENNSQSNHTVFEGCRNFCGAGLLRAYYITGSDGVQIMNPIIEGANPVNGIEFNDFGSTTVRNFNIHNLHIETSPTTAGIYLRQGSGAANISFYSQMANIVLVRCTNTTGGNIIIHDLSYIASGCSFYSEGQGGYWYFDNLCWQTVVPNDVTFFSTYFPVAAPFYKMLFLTNGTIVDGNGV